MRTQPKKYQQTVDPFLSAAFSTRVGESDHKHHHHHTQTPKVPTFHHHALSFTPFKPHDSLLHFSQLGIAGMAGCEHDPVAEQVPGTPGIREVRTEMGSEHLGFGCLERGGSTGTPGIRKVGLRAEIDTSPPFGSVKEAVTRFGGCGPWMPYYYQIGESIQSIEDMDIKKVEEQAAELEKHLIVKELETLDVLEELGATKRVVEELKQKLQKEALRCMAILGEQMSSPAVKESCRFPVDSQVRNLSPQPPDLILMELKQAKLNLGKTINDLGMIQTSVESLNKKMQKEKSFLQKTRKRLTSKFAGMLSLEEELKQESLKPEHSFDKTATDYKAEQLKKMAEIEKKEVSKAMPLIAQNMTDLRTAELRLVAAKKMEEAAKAAEAVALAEIEALSGNEPRLGYVLPEPRRVPFFGALSPLTQNAQKPEWLSQNKVEAVELQKHEANFTKMSILKMLREATEEVKRSKQALEEALNKVEMANRKQLDVEDALHKWMFEGDREGPAGYYSTGVSNSHCGEADHFQGSPLTGSNIVTDDGPNPVLRSTVSMRDVLNTRKAEEYATAKPIGRQKVALSQMLQELREDLKIGPRAEKGVGDEKQFITQRRKFGFIHISLPMTKPNKKKMQDLNRMMHH